MHLANYLGYLHKAELHLAEAFRKVGEGHAAEADVYHTCNTLAKQCEAHAQKLGPFVERYGKRRQRNPTVSTTSSSPRRDPAVSGSFATCRTST